jgi:hypothetical protein
VVKREEVFPSASQPAQGLPSRRLRGWRGGALLLASGKPGA